MGMIEHFRDDFEYPEFPKEETKEKKTKRIKGKELGVNKLTSKLLKGAKKNGLGDTLKDSLFSKIDYYLPLKSVLLNLLFSAKWNGGIPAGRISMPAGAKSLGKSQIAYDCAIDFQKNGGTIVLFDSEFASEQKALENLGIDSSNVIYYPVAHMKDEDKTLSMTYQLKKIMDDIERGDKVLCIFDSMGAWISKGTIANADKNNTAMNMKIASEKKELMALINSLVGMKGVPCLILNHNYANVGGFGAQTEVSGGGALYYPSSVVEITSKAKLTVKEVDIGSIMTAKVYKGRLSKEKSIGKFAMHHQHGFLPFFGLDAYAVEGGYIEEGKVGASVVYKFPEDVKAKVPEDKKELSAPKASYFLPEYNTFWAMIFKHSDFGQFLNDAFAYGSNKTLNSLEVGD